MVQLLAWIDIGYHSTLTRLADGSHYFLLPRSSPIYIPALKALLFQKRLFNLHCHMPMRHSEKPLFIELQLRNRSLLDKICFLNVSGHWNNLSLKTWMM